MPASARSLLLLIFVAVAPYLAFAQDDAESSADLDGATASDPVDAEERVARVGPSASLDVVAVLTPFTRTRIFRDATLALQVVDVQTGEPVFSHQAERALIPASTMKVLTSATALRSLGPAFRYTTDVYGDTPIDASGVLRGNLYVKGHGDPSLVVESLWKLLHNLRQEGLKQVRGNVIFDDTYMDRQATMPGWTKERDIENGPSYFATSSALSLNFNTVALVVGPGFAVGEPARVQLDTSASTYVTVDNKVLTGPPGSRRALKIERLVADERMTFELSGSVPSSDPVVRYYRTVADPAAHFIAAWRDLATDQGIEVTGRHRLGTVPSSARLIMQHRSSSLTSILMDMNKHSNNFMAEQVLKTVGAETSGEPGSVATGLVAVRSYLEQIGVKDPKVRLVNGSGLSREARLTPIALNKVMVDMATHPTLAHEFKATLSLAGWDGTMWSRLTEDPGRVRGKTGTIDGVHCLTGYVRGSDDRLYAFTFLSNDLRGGSRSARQLHDRLLRSMFNAEP